jgi:hypothetical protein
MQMPNVENLAKDSAAGITYRVLAYRALTRTELLQAVAAYKRQAGARKPKRGTTVTIVSVIGST